MYRALVVSPPTIDVLEGGCRAGGPALYAGYAFRELGVEPYAVGPVGHATMEVVRVEWGLGIRRAGYMIAGPGMVFEISYEGPSRTIRARSSVPVIDTSPVLGVAGGIGYLDVALVSPVYGEEYGGLPLLLQGYSRMVALDVQGYSRRGLLYPWSIGEVQVVHASEGEAPYRPSAWLFLLTRGPGRVDVYMYGRLLGGVDPPGGVLEDPTGAGDAFTAAFLGYLLRGYGVEDSVALASEVVPSLLEEVHGGAWIGDCSV